MKKNAVDWSVRIISGGGTREERGYPTKRAAYRRALIARTQNGHTPITRDGHTYVVTAER